MIEPIELIQRPSAGSDNTLLVSPDVGLFTSTRTGGSVLVPGETVGFLTRLGLSYALLVPEGAAGRITNQLPERMHAPVEYGQTLFCLEPLGDAVILNTGPQTEAMDPTQKLTFPAPQTGRFWHRPAPDDPAFCQAGDKLKPGSPIGLIEIMKTYTQVNYQPTGNLPAVARVIRIAVSDGGEVTEGDTLIEVE